MSKELTEAKELNRQAAEKIKEYELLEEARRRGFIEDIKFKALTDGGQRTLKGPLYIHHGNVRDYTGSIIYDERIKEWAEIIPEEDDIYLSLVQEKSLHDQIREGGWNKVWELAGNEFDFQTIHSRPLAAKMVEKTVNYIKLLALSKVLNEGKERGCFSYQVVSIQGLITPNESDWGNEPIEFFTSEDRDFAINFAEKEWKIFYNAK